MHGVTGSSFSGYSTIKVWLLIELLIYFSVAFSQGLFLPYDFFFTFAKLIGLGKKWETSEPDTPKCGKSYEISFTTVLNTLCKTVPMFHVDNDVLLHSGCIWVIRTSIL